MEKLILIRNGETDHWQNELTEGWTNGYLTDYGIKQAQLTGRRLRSFLRNVSFQFYSSDLTHTMQTAEIIGDLLDKEPISNRSLRDLNNGLASGKTKDNAKKLYQKPTEPRYEWIAYPNAESQIMLYKRIDKFLSFINQEEMETVVMVSHHAPIVCIIHWWLGLSQELLTRVHFDIDPCSLTRLRINTWGARTISALNDVRHLFQLRLSNNIT